MRKNGYRGNITPLEALRKEPNEEQKRIYEALGIDPQAGELWGVG